MKKVIIFSILVLLILASCSPTIRGRPGTNGDLLSNVHLGEQGLTVEFLEQAPPEELYEGEEFDVQIILHNKGAYSLTDKYAARVLVDAEPSSTFIDLTSQSGGGYLVSGITQIEGKSYNYPTGEDQYLSLGRFKTQDIRGNFQTNEGIIDVDICYPYRTVFADQVCIDTSSDTSNVRDQVCVSKDERYSQGQGAPIAVTSIETRMIPKGAYTQPQFIISIKNEGSGVPSKLVTQPNSGVEVCTDIIEPNDIGVIFATVTLGPDELTCIPEQIILDNDVGEVRCQLSEDKILAVASNYETTLTVELDYLYTESYEQEIVVERSPDIGLRGDDNAKDPENCFPWQVFDQTSGVCVDLCIALAENKDSFIRTNLVEPNDNVVDDNYLYSVIDCVYSDASDCKDAGDNLCILEQNYCQPGRFCGVPECIFDNSKPQFSETQRVGDDIRFYCADVDDADNLKGTCGCSTTAFYAFTQEKEDCDDRSIGYRAITGQQSPFGVEFEVNVASAPTDHLCLLIEDKLGQTRTQRINAPYTVEWRN